ncbi:MAG: DUF5606 domain-containing protein [Bacteroidetes bacterium]|nr:DUF5606 domain-containing protein [Bacteroidota bacterium]
MDLSKILAITGKSGLFKVVSQGKKTVIVESLIDSRRCPAFGNEKISSLEEISVFTTGDDIPLKDVFKAIYKKLEANRAPEIKSDDAAMKKFFLEMVPEYDQERVHVSAMKKMVSWYNLLLEHQLLDFSDEANDGEVSVPVEGAAAIEESTFPKEIQSSQPVEETDGTTDKSAESGND